MKDQRDAAPALFTEESIRGKLRHSDIPLQVYDTIDSTNTALKRMAPEGAPEGTCLLAKEQTAGRGRLGRSFYSPSGSGLYLSMLLRPQLLPISATHLTCAAAVAVCETIEDLTDRRPVIKWVNDIYVDGKKVCGILTEGALNSADGTLSYAIVGIGINLLAPEGGFPEEIARTAGALDVDPGIRSALSAGIIDRLLDLYEGMPEASFLEAYRQRSFLLGQPILVYPLAGGDIKGEPYPATVLSILPDFSLLVRLEDGTTRAISSGEVSVRGR